MFGEAAEPGEARLLAKIAKTRAWVRLADGSSADLKLIPPAHRGGAGGIHGTFAHGDGRG